MAMVYQRGNVYEKGTVKKKGSGKFRVYMRDQDGKEVERTRRVVGLKSELRKHAVQEKLQTIIREENGLEKGSRVAFPQCDDSVTFSWFVAEPDHGGEPTTHLR